MILGLRALLYRVGGKSLIMYSYYICVSKYIRILSTVLLHDRNPIWRPQTDPFEPRLAHGWGGGKIDYPIKTDHSMHSASRREITSENHQKLVRISGRDRVWPDTRTRSY